MGRRRCDVGTNANEDRVGSRNRSVLDIKQGSGKIGGRGQRARSHSDAAAQRGHGRRTDDEQLLGFGYPVVDGDGVAHFFMQLRQRR